MYVAIYKDAEEKEIEMMSNKKIVDYWIGLGMPKAYAHRIIKDLH